MSTRSSVSRNSWVELVAVAVDVDEEPGLVEDLEGAVELLRTHVPHAVGLVAVVAGFPHPGGEALQGPVEHELHPPKRSVSVDEFLQFSTSRCASSTSPEDIGPTPAPKWKTCIRAG